MPNIPGSTGVKETVRTGESGGDGEADDGDATEAVGEEDVDGDDDDPSPEHPASTTADAAASPITAREMRIARS